MGHLLGLIALVIVAFQVSRLKGLKEKVDLLAMKVEDLERRVTVAPTVAARDFIDRLGRHEG